MKKLIIFGIMAMEMMAMDFTKEIGVKYRSDSEDYNLPISLKLNGSQSFDKFYTEIEVKNSIEKSSKTEKIDYDFQVSKAYGEYYGEKYTLTLGRQTISWGNAFIFNRLNSLNQINILNPTEKNSFLDGVKLKVNVGDSQRLEAIVFENNDSFENYALRYTRLMATTELMLNYIKREKDMKNPRDKGINDIIIDVKGDLLVGLWGQYSYNFDRDKNSYLLGVDYSFAPFDKTLYLLLESSYEEENKLFLNYFRYNYSINDWNSLSGGILFKEGEKVVTTSINHKLNDFVELNLSHIYLDSSSYKQLMQIKGDNTIELEIKAVF